MICQKKRLLQHSIGSTPTLAAATQHPHDDGRWYSPDADAETTSPLKFLWLFALAEEKRETVPRLLLNSDGAHEYCSFFSTPLLIHAVSLPSNDLN